MELLSEWRVHELTYRYSSSHEKSVHIDTMERRGYSTVSKRNLPQFMRDDLTVSYKKNEQINRTSSIF